jgi:hypothetical protein
MEDFEFEQDMYFDYTQHSQEPACTCSPLWGTQCLKHCVESIAKEAKDVEREGRKREDEWLRKLGAPEMKRGRL